MALDFLGPAVDTLKSATNSLLQAAGISLPGSSSNIYEAAKAAKVFDGKALPWSYSGQDWYKVFPYAFVVEADKKTKFTYTLPIPPQSLVTKMVPASSATPTVGGVVEETSDNVFWVIQMAGTTGTAVSRQGVSNTQANRTDVAKEFRKKLETTGLLSGVASNLNLLVAKVGNTADAVISGLESGSVAGGIGGVVGAVNNALLPQQPYSGSSVSDVTNGFTEMQELHRFLYTYSHLKGAFAKRFILKFKNYKTGQEWRVILQDFTIQQSAQNPNLYKYNIQLKAWGVAEIDKAARDKSAFDRFGPDGDLKAVNTVGVDGLFKGFKGLKANFNNNSSAIL